MKKLVLAALPTNPLLTGELPRRGFPWDRPTSITEVVPSYLCTRAEPGEPSPSRPADRGRTAHAQTVVYYPGPRIVVTNRRIHTVDCSYPIHELDDFECTREYGHANRTLALICGAVELALAIPLAVAYGAALLLCTGLLAAIGLAMAILLDRRHNPRWMALHATHRGCTVTLFTSPDRQEFESVRRAVIRAVEAGQPSRL